MKDKVSWNQKSTEELFKNLYTQMPIPKSSSSYSYDDPINSVIPWKELTNAWTQPTTKKEHTMELFKFTTVRPPAEVIWDTLLKADIKHTNGISLDHSRFAMFCILQLEPDFKKAKQSAIHASHIHEAAALIGVTKEQFLSINTNIPTHYPSWVNLSLYQPYYMAKQLLHLGADGAVCIKKLLGRPEEFSKEERAHMGVDWMGYSSKEYIGLTAWMLDNVPIDYYFQHSIKFDLSRTVVPIIDRAGMSEYIKSSLEEAIAGSENSMLKANEQIYIPQFVFMPYVPHPPYESEEVPF